MKNVMLASMALLLPVAGGASPELEGVVVRSHGSSVEFHASGHLGHITPAELADADRLVQRLPADVALPAAARRPGAFQSSKHFPIPRGGTIVRLEQRIGGVPVDGATLSVRVDGTGELRWTAGNIVDPARAARPVPTLAPREAVARANALSAMPSANRDRARLVYLQLGDSISLAYRVDLPAQPGRRLDAPTVWIDAHDGRVLARVNRIRFLHQARIWPENPVSTPDLVQVTLPDLSEGDRLVGDWIETRNCLDDHERVTLDDMYSIHVCTERTNAFADSNGDFLFEPVLDPFDDRGNSDPFAEAHGYYHVMQAYEFFRSLGLEEVGSRPLPVTVNYRYPFGYSDLATWENAQDPYGLLFPYDNAFFLPRGQGIFGEDRPYDSIVFGQGTYVDYGYDGGVFYHEFTHAVIEATANLGWAVLDSYGLDGAPGAMNEGYADYFSNAMTGDPVIGEYAGGEEGIRTAENNDTCPGSIYGETHMDSEVWAGALWDLRKLFGPDVDQAVYNALIGLPSKASFLTAAEATITEVGILLGEGAAAQARQSFDARGLLGCGNRIIELQKSGEGRSFMYLGGTYMGYAPAPSYMQYRIETLHPITKLEAQIDRFWTDSDYPAEVWVLAKPGGDPIHFSANPLGRVSHDATMQAQFTSNRQAVVEFATPIPAGPVYFALLNRGLMEAMIRDFQIVWTEDEGTGGTGGSGGDGGAGGSGGDGIGGAGGSSGEGGAGGAGGGSDQGGETDGCGCRQASGPSGTGLFVIGLALLARRRRS